MWLRPRSGDTPTRLAELHPGGLSVVGPGWILQTLVGSCVAVVLWDPNARRGGMCHFVLSHRTGRANELAGGGSLDPRYGVEALALMKQRLGPFFSQGAGHAPIAHVVGGAAMLDVGDTIDGVIGRANINLALRWVEDEGLTLGEVQVGGHAGRRIRFNTTDGALAVFAVAEPPVAWPSTPWFCSMWPA